jgi:glycine dehydrogenase subunit 2
MREQHIFDRSREERKGYSLCGNDTPELPLESILPSKSLRKAPAETQLNICCS